MDNFIACKKYKILQNLIKIKNELILIKKIKSSDEELQNHLIEFVECGKINYLEKQINLKKILKEINNICQTI